MNLLTFFLTGLLTGGLTCLAVQGGLLAATLAQREDNNKSSVPILAFLFSKLFAYTILNIFNVHPVFRYFIIQPPRFLTKIIHNQSKSKSIFAPALLGFFTIFIPCGTTQAMMALAIGSANPISSGLIMFSFILGTLPVFFILGFLAKTLGETLQNKFMKIAAIAIILLAIFNFNNALALLGGGSIIKNIYCTVSFCGNLQETKTVNEATITFESNFYNPNVITVKSGEKITLHLLNKAGYGCIQSFVIPKLGIRKVVPVGSTEIITFKAPREPTEIPFMCSMGMYRGVIKVI